MRFAALFLAAAFSCSLAQAQSHWNQFRGPTGDGHAGNPGLPLKFGEKENLKWKTPIPGKAWSSPVVWDKQIWVTNAPEDGKKLYAVCVDLDTGRVVHNILVFEIEEPQFCHEMNSYATPTPFVEEGRAYVHFGAHGTACLDTKTGEKLWTRQDLECNHFRGPASSPIVYGDKLFIHYDGFDLQYVIALNKDDGSTIWKTDRAIDFKTTNGDLKKAYCTPSVIRHQGQLQLISPGAVATEAFEPDSGKLLWTVYHDGMNASARPIFDGELLFITNGMGRMVAVRPGGTGDITDSGIAWESGKMVPKKSSMLLIDGLLYMISDNGVASCVEPKTGENVWSHRINGDMYAASPIYADGRIYFFSDTGHVPVIQPGREYKLLAENQLDSGFMASPAIAGKSLILRSKTHLYCFEETAASADKEQR